MVRRGGCYRKISVFSGSRPSDADKRELSASASLEKRVAELESLVQQDEIKQVDASRFIALVRKYRDCGELTDTMLYAFIDRIEVHEATGGRTIYRQQNIDIHFNFIGNYYPPV